MGTVKTAFESAFMDGVEAAVPKIAQRLLTSYDLPLDDGTKVAQEWLEAAFANGSVETKTAFAPPGGGFGSTYGMQNNLPSQRMRTPGVPGRHNPSAPNNFAGAPAPISGMSAGLGLAGAGGVGMGMVQQHRAQQASNAVFNNLKGQIGQSAAMKRLPGAAQMTPRMLQAEAADRTGKLMPRWLSGQNRRMSQITADVAKMGLDPKAAAGEIEKRFLAGAGKGAKSLGNLKNFLQHNALKGSATRWGLGGLGLLGLSQLM